MKRFLTKTMLVLGVAATVTVGAINPTFSAPLASNSGALKEAAPTDYVTLIRRWRGRHYGGALLGLGALALIYEGARRHDRRHYYYGGYHRGGGQAVYDPSRGRYVVDCTHRGRWIC